MIRQIVFPLMIALGGSAIPPAESAAALQRSPAGHTKRQAEANLLTIAPRAWKHSRIPDLIDPHTGLLRDNVRAVCKARSTRLSGARYRHFRCVIHPWPAQGRQELSVIYDALKNGRFRTRGLRITWH